MCAAAAGAAARSAAIQVRTQANLWTYTVFRTALFTTVLICVVFIYNYDHFYI